jgi:hypothetical protein
MKKFMKNNILKVCVVLLSFALTNCLDDSKYALDPSSSNNVIEFLDPSVPISPSGSVYPVYIEAFPVTPQASFERTISFSGPNENDKDISLTLAVDPTALDTYNQQMNSGLNGGDPLNGDTYELLPADHYDLGSLNVTLPKGQREVKITINIFPELFDLSKKYALPVRIASASSGILSAHFSVGVFALVVKNQFDAAYTTDVLLTGWAAYGIQDGGPFIEYPGLIGLATTGPNTVSLQNIFTGSNLLPGLTTAGGATQFGNSTPLFTFDSNNKLVDVTNAIFPNSANRQFIMNPAAAAEENIFNPETRSVKFNFIMTQPGRPNQNVKLYMDFKRER